MSTVTQASDDEADSAEDSPLDEVPPEVLDSVEMREIDKVAACVDILTS